MNPVTATLITGAIVFGSSLGVAQTPQPQTQPSPRPQTEQPRTGEPQAGKQGAMGEIVLQGCLARDESQTAAGGQTTPGAKGAAGAAAGAGQVFLLRNAKRSDASGAGATSQGGATAKGATTPQAGAGAQGAKQGQGPGASGMGAEATYRLVASGANVNLAEHVGHQVEVRGRMTGGTQGSAAGGGQAVQGGQTQAAGQTAQSGQGGQSGQSTQAGKQSPRTGSAAGEEHQTVTVSSVRMISQTCTTSR